MIVGTMKRGVQMIHGHEWMNMITPLVYWKIDLLVFWSWKIGGYHQHIFQEALYKMKNRGLSNHQQTFNFLSEKSSDSLSGHQKG